MSIKQLFDQFVGGSSGINSNSVKQGLGSLMGNQQSNHQATKQGSGLSQGLIGGVAAGGIVSLLMSSKKARKFTKKAATVGGAALLGGVAYNVYKNWQNKQTYQTQANQYQSDTQQVQDLEPSAQSESYQLTLMKAMIAAAKADGHIDQDEQKRIFEAVEQMGLSSEDKGLMFDLLNTPISINEIANSVSSLEQKSEIYLASCLVCGADHQDERRYLDKLALALDLPHDLTINLEAQAFDNNLIAQE